MSRQRFLGLFGWASLLACCLLLLSVAGAYAAPDSGYKVIRRLPVGGEGGWDYLLADTAAHRLYVTHGARVEVLDTTTGEDAA